MATSGIIPVANETRASSSRITREGKKLTYRMQIIQQPERARACGAGAKSSADRRPVDPPPIVRLKVFEGPNAEHDITMSYSGYFFLFATLENARQLAHGRVQQPTSMLPVLTGSPVAGMAYLDRPEPAGYFVFPDLSVRHEGKFRLCFSLYEDVKDAKDMDSETSDEKPKGQHVCHRLEVKSVPFSVFSAKRFPGLAESTNLSKIFAEQGCRVRIRREVRMRRRGAHDKTGRDYDDYDDAPYDRRVSITPDPYGASHAIGTPQAHYDHAESPRSTSVAAYAHQRRASGDHAAMHPYPQPGLHSPHSPHTMYPPSNQWPDQQPQQSYMPPPAFNPQQAYQPPHSQAMGPPMPYVQQPYPYENGHVRHNSMEYAQPPRSSTTPQPTPAQPFHKHMMQPYQSPNQAYPPQSQHLPNQPQYPHAPQPLPTAYPAPIPQVQKLDAPSPSTTKNDSVQAMSSPSTNGYYDSHALAAQDTSTGSKRAYGQSFDTSQMDAPLRQGARPAETPYVSSIEASLTDDEGEFEEDAMQYRRADGSQRLRKMPLGV